MCDPYLTIDGAGNPKVRLFSGKGCTGDIYTLETGKSDNDLKNSQVKYNAKSIAIPGAAAVALWDVPHGQYKAFATQINLRGPLYKDFPVEQRNDKIKHPESISSWFQLDWDGDYSWDGYRRACCLGQGTPAVCGTDWTPGIPTSQCYNYLRGYCPNNLDEEQCQNYCINNPSAECTGAKGKSGALKYCEEHPKDPFCACLSADWGPLDTSIPYCIDKTCITRGYKPPSAPKECKILQCNQIIDIKGVDNSYIKNLQQICKIASGNNNRCLEVSPDTNNPKCTKCWINGKVTTNCDHIPPDTNGGNGDQTDWKQWIEDNLMIIMVVLFILAILAAFVLHLREKNQPLI